MAAKSRAIWPDKAKAKKSYNGRGALRHGKTGFWTLIWRAVYCQQEDGFVWLATPHWEAANFKGPQLNCNRYIRRLTMPFTLLTAEHGSTTRARAAFHALRQDKKIQVVDGATHFLADGNARLFAR